MPEHDTQLIPGWILAVQEERFRLLSRDGQGYLLTLANHADATPQDLRTWYLHNTPVVVWFGGEPNTETGIAMSIQPAI